MTDSFPFLIRSATDRDRAAAEILDARVEAYRPEDRAEVQRMYVRADSARAAGDHRWMEPVLGVSRPHGAAFPGINAYWIAAPIDAPESVVGAVGAEPLDGHDVIRPDHPLMIDWHSGGPVAELRRLRVAPEFRRRGLGTRLCRTVIDWSALSGYERLVLNTTTPQMPARELYHQLGFVERGVSFVGRYELVWMELRLSGPPKQKRSVNR